MTGTVKGEEREATFIAREAIRRRACKVADHLAKVIRSLSEPSPSGLDDDLDFVEAAYRMLFPEPWLTFAEAVHRASVEGDGRDDERIDSSFGGSVDACRRASLALKHFSASFPELAERAWPRQDPTKNRKRLLDVVAAWGGRGGDQQRWEALREVACCFHPDDPDDPRQNLPRWDSMNRQWRKHARHAFLPLPPDRDP